MRKIYHGKQAMSNKECYITSIMAILEKISTANDIRKFSDSELETLAGELRERIISVVSRRGGHLAPNLGTVELTIALLKSFDLPDDHIIWDVGHQSYSFKLLTGRADEFENLRQFNGCCGFLKPFFSQSGVIIHSGGIQQADCAKRTQFHGFFHDVSSRSAFRGGDGCILS